jgi:hypothetical protein
VALIRNWSCDLVLLTDCPANLNEAGRLTLGALDVPVREERILHLEGVPDGTDSPLVGSQFPSDLLRQVHAYPLLPSRP